MEYIFHTPLFREGVENAVSGFPEEIFLLVVNR